MKRITKDKPRATVAYFIYSNQKLKFRKTFHGDEKAEKM